LLGTSLTTFAPLSGANVVKPPPVPGPQDVSPSDSPNGLPLVLVTNETASTVGVWQVTLAG